MINDALKTLLSLIPDAKPEGYWKDKNGYIIKIKPTIDDDDYYEELLFYIEDDSVEVANPMDHPIILNEKMIKI